MSIPGVEAEGGESWGGGGDAAGWPGEKVSARCPEELFPLFEKHGISPSPKVVVN